MAKANKKTEKDTIIVSGPGLRDQIKANKSTTVVSVEKYNELKADYKKLEEIHQENVKSLIQAVVERADTLSDLEKARKVCNIGKEIADMLNEKLKELQIENDKLRKDLKTSYSFTQSLLNRGMQE
jgi:hypothetical protein